MDSRGAVKKASCWLNNIVELLSEDKAASQAMCSTLVSWNTCQQSWGVYGGN